MREFIIGPNDAGQRFDKYLFKLLKNAGSGLIFKQLRNKNITLNNSKSKGNEILKESDVVKVFMADDTIEKFMGSSSSIISVDYKTVLKVVYEDENIILCDKPMGVLSQKANPDDISMNEYLLSYRKNTVAGETTFKPAFCNRLDRNTSGMMVGGLSLKGLQKMSEIIKDRTLNKYYLAVVTGKITEKSVLKGYLYKDEATNKVVIKECDFKGSEYIHTEYEPVAVGNGISLIKVHLITGKTHQIRAHLAFNGHGILGDNKYGDVITNRSYGVKGQLLHSYQVVFPKLDDEFSCISEKSFVTEYPESFERFFSYNEVKEKI